MPKKVPKKVYDAVKKIVNCEHKNTVKLGQGSKSIKCLNCGLVSTTGEFT